MRKLVIGIVVLVVVGAAVFFGYQKLKPAQAATPVQTATVTRGNLVMSVAGAASISSKNVTNQSFRISGKVKTVNVQQGDRVQAGQVLMELDTTDLEVTIAKAKLSLATAEQQFAKAKIGSTAAEIAAAKANLVSAQQKLADVKAGPSKAQIASAEASLRTAQDNLNTLYSQPTAESIASAKAKLDQAKNSLWASQSQRDSTCGQAVASGNASSAACNSANASVANAEINVQLAEVAYADAQKPATAVAIEAATAQVANAQDTLDKLRASPTAADIASAEAAVATAQATLDTKTTGPTAQDLAISQASVDQAKITLEQAQRALEDAKLTALFAGTVTAVNYRVGESANAGATAVGLVDLSTLELVVPLAEVDVARVAVGQAVTMTLDALTGVKMAGAVKYVSPVATITQGVVNYNVTIQIPKPDAAVRPGMTASATIVVERHDNVLLVPNRAVSTSGRQKLVTVLSADGTEMPIQVTVGSTGESFTEITAGLNEGDKVVLRTTATSSSTRGLGGGFIMGGGPPG
jgi:HlyD family secretion protein